MSASAMGTFMDYFQAFEEAISENEWTALESYFHTDARYSVEGVPFACEVSGRDAILTALQRSTGAFDATMDFRMLEIISMLRVSENTIRVDLVSGYGRDAIGSMTAPVSMEVTVKDNRIQRLRDIYDQTLTRPGLAWLAVNAPDADPTYL